MKTKVCERCGGDLPRFEVKGVGLCARCYEEFIKVFQAFLDGEALWIE